MFKVAAINGNNVVCGTEQSFWTGLGRYTCWIFPWLKWITDQRRLLILVVYRCLMYVGVKIKNYPVCYCWWGRQTEAKIASITTKRWRLAPFPAVSSWQPLPKWEQEMYSKANSLSLCCFKSILPLLLFPLHSFIEGLFRESKWSRDCMEMIVNVATIIVLHTI